MLCIDSRERNTELMRDAIHTRYALLPYFYTLFREANTSGVPVMRPLWMEFPSDKATFSNDEAFMVGNSLLVQGIYTEVLLEHNFYLFWFVLLSFFLLVSLLHFLRCNPVFLKLIHKLNSFQPASEACISVFARGTVLVWPENWNYLQRRYDTQVRGFRRDYSCFSKGWNHHTKERPVSTKLYPDGKWSLHSGEYLMLKWPFYKYAAASDYLKYGCAYVSTLSYSIFISIFVVFALRDLNSHFSILLGL